MRALLLLAGLAACSPKTGDDPGDGSEGSSGDGADSGLAVDEGTCDASGGRLHWVVDELWFARIEDGVSDGFDLDGDSSTVGGDGGCGVADEVGPDGQAGIDNAFGKLIPALELTEFVAAEDLINSTIRSGELLLLGELSGVDDLTDDDCVGMAMRRATGEPLLGTDGAFLPGQTLDLDPEFSDVELAEQQLVDGVASGRPFQLDLPVQVLNASLEFQLRDGAMRLDLTEDGDASGIFAGGLNTADLIAVAGEEGIDESVVNVLSGLLDNVADLDPDESGQCQAISVTLGFHATPVYIYEDAW
jgi:hypothetical protein